MSDGALTVRWDRVGAMATIRLAGELDLGSVAEAEAALAEAEADAPETVLLDLSGLRFVDSSGVRLVLLADARAGRSGRRLVIELGSGPARRLFDVLGLLTRLDLVDGV